MAALQATFTLPDLGRWLPYLVTLAQQTSISSPTLKPLHDALIEPFRTGVAPANGRDTVGVTVANAESREEAIAARLLAYGYCSHYFTGTDVPRLPEEPSSHSFQQYTLIANCGSGDTLLVLGTLQVIVGDTVPALTLFEPVGGTRVPHRAKCDGQLPARLIGELRRFSVNPLLEVKPDVPDDLLIATLRNYRSLVYRGLYELSLQMFDALGTRFVYGIATPEIYRFFTRSGMVMFRLDGMRLAENAEVRTLQAEFAGYWRPQAPPQYQPALYRILLPAPETATSIE